MKLKRDSLLLKTILYNDLSMLLTGLTIIALVVGFVFKELEKNFSIKAVEKFHIIENILEIKNNELMNELVDFVNSDNFIEDEIFTEIEGVKEEKIETYNKLMSKLIERDFTFYQGASLTLLSNDGRVFSKGKVFKGYDNIYIGKIAEIKNRSSMVSSSLVYNESGKNYYYEILIPMKDNKEISFVLINIPLDEDYFNKNKFLLVVDYNGIKEIGIYKDWSNLALSQIEQSRMKKKDEKIIQFADNEYHVKTAIINNIDHNVVSKSVYNYEGDTIGYMMLCLAEPALTKFKNDTMSLIIIATIILILINSFVISGTFKQLLLPLEELSMAVDDIASGNLDRNVRLKGTSEIKVLSLATKKMVEKLKDNNLILEGQNDKLKSYIKRVEGVEKLLLEVRREPRGGDVINLILEGFTSGEGLNYDRAIFLEYNSENDCLAGKKIKKSKNIKKEDKLSSFDLRYETMKELVALIRIENDNNMFRKAIKERRIVFENRRGYKTYLGSELLHGFGIGNFMILPIFNKEKNIGCILVDNYISGRRIEVEDVELFNVILLNIGIHYENSEIESDRIRNERDIAIGRMFQKIIHRRNKVIEKYIKMMMDLYKKDQIKEEAFIDFRNTICSINREDSILFDYSDKKEYNFEKIEINSLLTEIAEGYVRCDQDRDISLFLGEIAYFRGDTIEMTKALREIINNSLKAIEKSTDGRINIVSKINKESISIKIYDNGKGIPEHLLNENIFEPFASGSKDRSGLGLAIAKKIIESHEGGFIKIDSTCGSGTEVKIILNRYKEDINV